MALTKFSAYHGGSWRDRLLSHQEEVQSRPVWPQLGLNSEYLKLKEVILYRPPPGATPIRNPERVQHLAKINFKILLKQQRALAKTLQQFGIRVHWMDAHWFPEPKPNLMFARDHYLMTPWGAILGRMASPVRAGEEKWAQVALALSGTPILRTLTGRATFEGADGLWITPRLLAVGVGNRTNREALLQIRLTLREFNVTVIAVNLPKTVQHLLGLLQIVSEKKAIVRQQLAPLSLIRRLSSLGFDIIPIEESEEVCVRQGMNILTLSPNKIIMPRDCPNLRETFENRGLKVLAEVEISQLLNGAGGLACATAPLARTLRKV